MGYLILPTLLESAFFTEASKEMRSVLGFHTGARRDSLDMMGKAFQYGNYMRALELSRFVAECQKYVVLFSILCRRVIFALYFKIYILIVFHFFYAFNRF